MNIADLLTGNKEFAHSADKKLLRELAEKGQQPIAAVVACSDSRVPVEVIFNRLKPGTLFIIRVAGNVVADAGVCGSIEYAVEHLHVPCLIVLGHTGCGAVKASLDGNAGGEIGKLLDGMKLKSKDMAQAVLENIDLQVKNVLKMDCVREALENGKLEVYGMLCDLPTGAIKLLSKNGQAIAR